MKKLRPRWLVYGMVLMLMTMVPISATAGGTPNGQPFLEIWEELEDLQEQIDNQTADIDDLQAQLDAEIAARIAGDDALQAEIDAEEIARIAADIALQAAIDAEEAARIAADLALQANIDAEAAARIAADLALQAAINAEEAARIAADAALQANIDAEEAARIAGDAALQANIDALAAEDALDYDSLADLEAAMANGVNLATISGNVGIGTTSPTEKLDVAGNIHASGSFIAGSTTTYGDGFIGLSSGTNLDIDSGTLSVDNADNQVGIGTTTPGTKLEIYGDGSHWSEGFISLKNMDNDAGIRLYDGASTVKHHIFNENGQGDRLRIAPEGNYGSGGITVLQNGNVGIGTTSPYCTLAVYDTQTVEDGLRVDKSAPNSNSRAILGYNTATPASGYFSHGVFGWATSDAAGNKVGVRGQATGAAMTNYGGYFVANGATNNYGLYVADGEGYFADNVGIGTTNPTQRLHVQGNARITGALYDSNNQAGASGQILQSTGSGTDWVNPPSLSDGDWTISGSKMYSSVSGNVGIGMTNPSHKLTVRSTDEYNMRLIGPNSWGHGARLNFGDSNYVYIEEDTDDHLLIHSSRGTKFTGGKVTVEDGIEITGGRVTVEDGIEMYQSYYGPGIINTFGDNSNFNCRTTYLSGYPNNGWIGVFDSSGTRQAGMYVNPSGKGIVWGDTKNFRVDNPNDPNTDIWYASVEGPEAAAYIRGTAQLVDGQAVITFPDHFLAVAVEEGMTVQVTPLSADSNGLAVTSKSLDGVVVQELGGGKGNYEFDWEVKCVRQGHEDYQVIRSKMDGSPGMEGDIPPEDWLLKDPVSGGVNKALGP